MGGATDLSTHTGVCLEAEDRPWGRFEVLRTGVRYKVKSLMVLPGRRTSLQSHRYRREVWTVVAGAGLLHIAGTKLSALEGQTFHVGYGDVHRIENVGHEPLVIIETQVGSYCGEDDIDRYEDDYGRGLSDAAENRPGVGLSSTLAGHLP